MATDSIIINYQFLKNEANSDVENIVNGKEPRYLTAESASRIKEMIYAKNAHQRLWQLISEATSIGLDNLTSYLNYKGNPRLNEETLPGFLNCFVPDAPVYLNATHFFRDLNESINRMFNSNNEKLCLVHMVNRCDIETWWTAQDIIKKCDDRTKGRLSASRIEECLNRHSVSLAGVPIFQNNTARLFYTRRPATENGNPDSFQYQLRLTELIRYYNEFKNDSHQFERPVK